MNRHNQHILSDFIKNNPHITCVSNRRLVYGVGVNDSDYLTNEIINGEKTSCQYYLTWKCMLMRCYCERFKLKQPSYIGCSVSKDWQIFSKFKSWMKDQDWKEKELDKDIINPGNKIYNKDSCIFVYREINALLANNKTKDGGLPQGVSFFKRDKNYKAEMKINGKQKFLGYFSTASEASKAYNKEKSIHITDIANKQKDKRIKEGLLRHAEIYLNN